jgi:hypothetical protein
VVESILRHRSPKNARELEVKWKGHSAPTWEPEENLRNTAAVDTVEAYWEQHAAQAAAKAATGVAIRTQAATDPIMVREREGRATQQSIYDAKVAKYMEKHPGPLSTIASSKMWEAALLESIEDRGPKQGRPKRRCC